jgi:hypothetical protein
MLIKLPRHLPSWPDLLADLGNPHPWNISQFLGVDIRTVRRWNQTGAAPRPAVLAVFWLTRWGLSELDAETLNRARNLAGLARCLRGELDTARGEVATLRASLSWGHRVRKGLHSDFEPGNAPFVDHSPPQQGQRPRLVQE